MFKPLEQLSLPQRIALAIAVVVIALLLLLFVSWLANEPAEAQTSADDGLYADVPFDPNLLALDKHALDEAYHDQVKHLWDIWLRGQARSTKEISTGLRLARSSYAIATNQIAKREQRQDFQLHRDQGQTK